MSRKVLYIIATFLNLLKLVFCPNIWSILENALCVLCKNVYSTATGWNGLYMSVRSWCFQNSLCLGFLSFNIMYLDKILFEFNLSVDLWASWTWMSISLHRFVGLISIPQKCQVLRASHLFSLGWCPEMFKFVSLFPILQSHAGFLHLVTSYLQKFAFMVCRSKCQNQAKKVGGVVMGQMCGVLGMPMSHLDSCRQGVSSG